MCSANPPKILRSMRADGAQWVKINLVHVFPLQSDAQLAAVVLLPSASLWYAGRTISAKILERHAHVRDRQAQMRHVHPPLPPPCRLHTFPSYVSQNSTVYSPSANTSSIAISTPVSIARVRSARIEQQPDQRRLPVRAAHRDHAARTAT